MGLVETKEAIDAAAKAFKTWGKTTAKVSPERHVCECEAYGCFSTLQHRHDILMKMYALMIEHGDDLGRIIVRPPTSMVFETP